MKRTHRLFDPIAETQGNTQTSAPAPKPTLTQLAKPQVPGKLTEKELSVKFSSDDMPDLEVDHTKVTVDDKKVTPTSQPKADDTTKKEEADTTKVDDKKEEKKEDDTSGISKHLKAPKDEKTEAKGSKEKVTQVKVPEKSEFDYTQYNAEEQHLLKNMSKESRAFTHNLVQQNKELSKLKDSSYLQHPQSYVLNPEFQKMQEDVSYAIKEGQHWQAQVEACKKGQKVKDITGWTDKGAPIYGAEVEPTDAVEEQCRMAMQNAFNQGQQLKGQLQQYPKQYQQRMQQDLQNINTERANRFQWVANPKLLDYSISVEGGGEKTIKSIKSDFINIFPPYLRSNPGVEVASDLMVAMMLQRAELLEAQANSKVANTKVDEVKRAEPSSQAKGSKPKEGVNGSPAVFTMDGVE